MIAWLGFVAGVGLLLGTASSIVKTLLLPRSSRSAFTNMTSKAVRGVFMGVATRMEDLAARERVLAGGPAAWLIAVLATWLVSLLAGFGLMLWPLRGGSLAAALTAAGSSLFTLGFVLPHGRGETVVTFVAAASGLGVVALLIAYLPALYAAFNRRETLVTMLEALAGAPPWGPELLARQALIGEIRYLNEVYDRWTEWAADISESHTNYRTLVYFRSPDPTTSWLLGLLAVLDAAALHLALNPESAPAQARPVLRVGYLTMRALAHGMGLPVNDDPHPDDPITLTEQDFAEAVEHLRKAGWTFERDPGTAWPQFQGWRVNYEAAAHALAHYLDLPPAPWSGPRPGHRGPPQLPVRPPHREPAQG
ncbi:MAG TPA: hypothetical protein VGS19_27380 [Streptosporangiaceae bacterium]|nr:hypothetical protein [Streptosporangiaceae bacterium]